MVTTAPSYLDDIAKDRLDGLKDEHAEKQAWPVMDKAAAYYGILGDVARLIEPHTESDPAAILLQAIVFAGSAMRRNAHYLVEGDKHYTNINAVLVGQSSKGRKGTSLGQVRRLFKMADETFDLNCIQSGLSSGEGLIWAVRDESENDPGVFDKRLLVLESEYAGLLRVMQRDGNIISRIIRDAWDRGDLGVMTKKFSTRATGAHISIIGHITADELKRYLDRTEAANGFANRFLFVAVKRSKCLPFGGNLIVDDLRELTLRIADALEFARPIAQVDLSDAAKALWVEVYPALSMGAPGLHGSITGRAEAQVIRIALIYALLDKCNQIEAEHLQAALAVWDYADESARFVFGDASGDPVRDTIATALKSAPDGTSRTQISAILGRHVKADRLDRTLADLRAAGLASVESVETAGRPKEIWRWL